MSDSIKVDLREVNAMALQLRNMHRSALPNVVRNTLNDLALDAKKNHLPTIADKVFENRTKNFFKAKSGVKKATGFDIKTMVAELGMLDDSVASRNLKFQEKGGKISKRAFIPLDSARISGSHQKKIAKRNQMSKVSFVNTARMPGNKKQRIFRGVYRANKQGKSVLHEGIVYNPKGVRNTKKGLKFKLKPIYDYKKGRSVRVKGTNFLQKTQNAAMRNLGIFFKKNFNSQIEKLKSKGRI